ncbi:hypothetical protein [Pseudomonas putida]|uniref:Alpha/beta hydrolase n=1 Tax=Pseudomonas putida TaxID=303 RepID=A0A1Q9R4K2_PSEPU|nr:hypothetical protein [Pseudomonas putida]OLS62275.1 hypothetical protein PSEMO_27390 [Pseudomonas putida]
MKFSVCLLLLLTLARGALAADLRTFELPDEAGALHYYASRPAGDDNVRTVLLVMHGHPRDAGRSFAAGLQAARMAGRLQDTLVVAPLYQVEDARHCSSPGEPPAQPGDALWTCGSWLAGEPSLGAHPISAFAALDALLVELVRQFPQVRNVTLAGFSAGAQMLQHSIAFAAESPAGVGLRYVIADPGSWLYFDPLRPVAQGSGFVMAVPTEVCAGYNAWKYGTEALPGWLSGDAAQARARYAAARVDYLEGGLDSSASKGAAYPVLDKSCGAMLQGPFRLQRGLGFQAYEREVLKVQRRMLVVPGCGHRVECVLPSVEGRSVLFDLP